MPLGSHPCSRRNSPRHDRGKVLRQQTSADRMIAGGAESFGRRVGVGKPRSSGDIPSDSTAYLPRDHGFDPLGAEAGARPSAFQGVTAFGCDDSPSQVDHTSFLVS